MRAPLIFLTRWSHRLAHQPAGAGLAGAALLPVPSLLPGRAAARWALQLGGLAGGILLACTLALRVDSSVQHELHRLRHRAALHELTNLVWTMPAMATARRKPLEIRVDRAAGAVHLIVLHGGWRHLETVEQTIWLPEGLELVQTGEPVIAWPGGRRSNGSLVLIAPAYNRLFQLTVSSAGVQLQEVPAL